jgi:hypothetical protein
MTQVRINYAAGRLPGPMATLLGSLLLIGLVCQVVIYQQLAEDNTRLQQQWQARQSALAASRQVAATPVVNQALAADIAAAQVQIQTPWLALLSGLERAQQAQLYWLQLSPDAKRKQVRMTVLAQQRQQGWALVERLKKQSGLADVKLKASEATEVNGLRMTTLHLEAGWLF